MTQIHTPPNGYVNTTATEFQQIDDFYKKTDTAGNRIGLNLEAIANDIQTGQSRFSTEDLITFYADQNNGLLPSFMMAPAGHMSSPAAYPWLWNSEVDESLTQLGQLFTGTNQQVGYTNFRTFMSQTTSPVEQTLFDDVQAFIDAHPVNDDEEVDDPNSLDLFNPNDLRAIMTLFMSMGNPGLALLMYSAYGLNPRMQDLQQAALDFIDEANETLADKMDSIEDLSGSDDPSAQGELERLRNEMSIIQSVIQTMTRFIENSVKVSEDLMEASSNLSAGTNRNMGSIIGNIR